MASSLGDVQHTFSSWDTCMTKEYCKWPVIVAIIIGSLIVLSIVFCIARCLCFGAECCACCFSCMSCCCPSRGRGRGRGGQGYDKYQQPPPPPVPYGQYTSPITPIYSQPSPYRGPQTATFESSIKSQPAARYNEDALPPMPSWENATTRHVEVEEEPLEMDRLDKTHQGQQQHLLAGQEQGRYDQQAQPPSPSVYSQSAYSQRGQSVRGAPRPYNQQNQGYPPMPQPYGQRSPAAYQSPQPYDNSLTQEYPPSPQGHDQRYAQSVSEYAPSTVYADQYRGQGHGYAGATANTNATPYHDYNNHQQYAPSMSPVSSTAYAPSTTVPPSYHTNAPSIVSPIQASYTPLPNRRPVQGSWRDV